MAFNGYTDISSSGPRYGLAPSLPRVGRTDISSSGPGYGVRPPAPGAAAPGGYNYYTQKLRNDAILQPYLGGITTQMGANTVGLGTQQSALLGRYGAVPGANVLGFTPSQEARDLAAASTAGGYSTTAQLAKAYGQTNAGDAAIAAATGRGHSGWVGQYMQQNQDAYQQQQAQALDELLGKLGAAQGNYLGQQQGLQDKAFQATNDTLGRYISAAQAAR